MARLKLASSFDELILPQEVVAAVDVRLRRTAIPKDGLVERRKVHQVFDFDRVRLGFVKPLELGQGGPSPGIIAGIAGIELDRLREVRDRFLVLLGLEPHGAPRVVDAGRFWIELECSIQIGQSLFSPIEFGVGEAAIDVGREEIRVEVQAHLKILDRLFDLSGREESHAPIVARALVGSSLIAKLKSANASTVLPEDSRKKPRAETRSAFWGSSSTAMLKSAAASALLCLRTFASPRRTKASEFLGFRDQIAQDLSGVAELAVANLLLGVLKSGFIFRRQEGVGSIPRHQIRRAAWLCRGGGGSLRRLRPGNVAGRHLVGRLLTRRLSAPRPTSAQPQQDGEKRKSRMISP